LIAENNLNKYRTVSKHPSPKMIAHSGQFETCAEAIKREKYFKSAAGRRFLKKKIHL